MNRRDFLTSAIATAILVSVNPIQAFNSKSKTLLVIELVGGNDGLNTFIPYTDPNYLGLRPTLGIKDSIPVTSTIGIHPAMKELKPILESGKLAVIQNVSYPNPNLSHFRARDIWNSAKTEGNADSGWVARYLNTVKAKAADAIFLGDEYPLALLGEKGDRYLQLSNNLNLKSEGKLGAAIQSIYNSSQTEPMAEQVRRVVLESEAAVKQLAGDLSKRSSQHGYPTTASGRGFALVGRLLESQPRVIYLAIGGWDTHVRQIQRQQQLLESLSQGLAALNRDITAKGMEQNVMTLVHSEFGRRAAQNGTGGTDHGTAAPVIVIGAVKPGFYGGNPELDSLVNGNLPMQVDFRSIYAEILNTWEGTSAKAILAQDYPKVGFL
jgi:uncharacterized protein (DUF1501 family)